MYKIRIYFSLLIALIMIWVSSLIGCNEDWAPVYFVEKLRVLGIRAQPPDLAPGHATQLEALVVDPSNPQNAHTLFWFACDPDPTSLEQPECAKYSTLEDMQEVFESENLPQGMRVLGISSSNSSDQKFPKIIYSSPEHTFSKLDPQDQLRQKGVLAIILLLAVDTTPPPYPPSAEEIKSILDKARNKQVDSLLAIKRIRISENQNLNKNPQIEGMLCNSGFWPAGLRPIKLQPEKTYELAGIVSSDSIEHYSEMNPDGQLLEKEERPIFSWFSSIGSLEAIRTTNEKVNRFLVSPQSVPSSRYGMIYQVLRDGRGGTSFASRALFFCDDTQPSPEILGIIPSKGPPGTTLRIQGTGLEKLLDVQIGSEFLANARWDETQKAYIGSIPSDIFPGTYELIPRGRGCQPDPLVPFVVENKPEDNP